MDTESKIINGAFSLYLKYGVKSVTMDDIAQNLGISKKTIYQFIENKRQLIKTVILNYLKEDEQAINDILKNADNAIAEMFDIAKHVNIFLTKMKPTLMYDLQKYYRQEWELVRKEHFGFIQHVIKNNIERGKLENLYRDDIDAEIISRFYTKVSEFVSDETTFPSSEYSKSILFIEHITYHMYGLVNENGRRILQQKNFKINTNA